MPKEDRKTLQHPRKITITNANLCSGKKNLVRNTLNRSQESHKNCTFPIKPNRKQQKEKKKKNRAL